MNLFGRKKDLSLNQKVTQLYGDLLSDFATQLLNTEDSSLTLAVLDKVITGIATTKDHDRFLEFERPWVFRLLFEEIEKIIPRRAHATVSPQEILMDTSLQSSDRLNAFLSYFKRLKLEDRAVLLLRDKYGFSYREIATILNLPEGSVKIKRQQALRTLEEWIWNRT